MFGSFQLQEYMIFKMVWLEITVDPEVVLEVKMCQVPLVSSHPAKVALASRKNYWLNYFLELFWCWRPITGFIPVHLFSVRTLSLIQTQKQAAQFFWVSEKAEKLLTSHKM